MTSAQQTVASRLRDRQTTGVINPYALVEAVLKRNVDWSDSSSTKLMSAILQTDYHQLFDPKFNSPLYAGYQLNTSTGKLEPLKPSVFKIVSPVEQLTPDLGKIKKLGDLEEVGVNDIAETKVSDALIVNGKLKLTLQAPSLDRTISNRVLTKRVADLTLPGTGVSDSGDWTPDGYEWKDMGDFFRQATEYDDPIQGAVGDCWLIAAMSAVAWSKPYSIVQRNRPTAEGDTEHVTAITLYGKGGNHDASTATVEVSDKTLVSLYGDWMPYCRSNDSGEIWPAVYEKAFAKWCTQSSSDCPDITQLSGGYSDIAMAQLTDTTPYYYDTWSRTPEELWGLVRENSIAFKTFNPMTANTYASGDQYSGSNIVAWHAYTVLGWTMQNGQKYIILRNPWGVTEPSGLSNTYDGILTVLDTSFWRHISTIANDGVFALEISAFKMYYAGLCVAK